MSRIVIGVGASHSTLMNTHFDEVEDRAAAEGFRDALAAARQRVVDARPDAIVVIGSNHFRGLYLDLLPTITLGVGECVASGESGTPKGPLPVERDLARHLHVQLVRADFDLAFSLRLQVDHGVTHALQYLAPSLDVPIVPVVMNMFAPPLLSLRRAARFGQALREAIEGDGRDLRVAVLGSGGLSHKLPWPDWKAPHSEDDRFLVEAWLNGREHWERFDGRRRAIIRAAKAGINPDFDERFLAALGGKGLDGLLDLTEDEVGVEAGNGAQEIRSWIATATACGDASADVLGYWPIPEWLTGMGVVVLEPAPTADRSDA
jgi:2,3-dihydroxyphenylpropionate 1,2-dioxygenase